MVEIWEPIIGYRKYLISDYGNVKSLDRVVNIHRNGTVYKRLYKGKLKTHKKDSYKYHFIDLWKNGKRKFIKIHRLVLCTFGSKKRSYKFSKQVNHIDGDKSNNHINNLEWVTPKQNILHAEKLGLRKHPKGIECYQTKLKEKDIPVIRKLFNGKRGDLSIIARKYKVTPATIKDVITKRSWKHIK